MRNRRIRSAAAALLALVALLAAAPRPAAAPRTEHVVLAGGCFWGMEAVFERLRGVTNVVAGFSGGSAATAHYEIVSTGMTRHAESVDITYDPTRISYDQLLTVFFTVAHDPTEVDRQGPDSGTQYRSAIFYNSDTQRRAAQTMIAKLTAQHAYRAPIVTQVVPFTAFYAAEAYHQHYADKNPGDPYIVNVDEPKVRALRAKFAGWLKG
jgi:peptide-methionine (S)-S-oxide reductase